VYDDIIDMALFFDAWAARVKHSVVSFILWKYMDALSQILDIH
jgi:hypothetical protein